jgi:uncharacterized protein (TIGR02145 family)
MKRRMIIRIFPLAALGMLFLLSAGCKKKDSSTSAAPPATITDVDGNVYHKVKIGTQVWMIENLRVTHYRNGDPVPNIPLGGSWSTLSTGAYCDYNDDPANSTTYGRLYNWFAVNDSRKIAPAGWHIPSQADLTTLVNYLGGDAVAGEKLKEAGTTHWSSPNTGATNGSGFTGLPGGLRYDSPSLSYGNIQNKGYLWTSAESDVNNSSYITMLYNWEGILYDNGPKLLGFSVRCIMD